MTILERFRTATRQDERDRGITIVELLVSMGMLAIVLAIVMAAIVTMSSNAVKAQATADAAADVRRVFQRLDKQVRYADAITAPGAGASGARYVELRTPSVASPTGNVMCTQWRWIPASGLIQMRSWVDVTGSPGAFLTVADHMVLDSTVTGYPFIVADRDAVHPHQELTVNVTVQGAEKRTITTESTFVARNSAESTNATPTARRCGAGLRP